VHGDLERDEQLIYVTSDRPPHIVRVPLR